MTYERLSRLLYPHVSHDDTALSQYGHCPVHLLDKEQPHHSWVNVIRESDILLSAREYTSCENP